MLQHQSNPNRVLLMVAVLAICCGLLFPGNARADHKPKHDPGGGKGGGNDGGSETAPFSFGWALAAGDADFDVGAGSTTFTDAGGKTTYYVVGSFHGTVDFDPLNVRSDDTLTSAGEFDVFVAAYSPDGVLDWVRRLGGTQDDTGEDIAVDAAGNIYASGSLDGDAAGGDAFVAKYDATGQLAWVREIGGSGRNRTQGVAVDSAGDVYAAAVLNQSIGLRLEGEAILAVKLDPADGSLLWQQTLSGTGQVFDPRSIAWHSGAVYVAGGIGDSETGRGEILAWKLDAASGNEMWLRTSETVSTDATIFSRALDVTVDAAGGVWTTGFFNGTVDFDPDPAASFEITAQSTDDIFIWKLDSGGGFLWAGAVGGKSDDTGTAIATDGASVYLTGGFEERGDFDPGKDRFFLGKNEGNQSILPTERAFVLKLDNGGNFVWAGELGDGGDRTTGFGITVDGAGGVYTAGRFRPSGDFDPTDGEAILTSNGDFDIFLVKLTQP